MNSEFGDSYFYILSENAEPDSIETPYRYVKFGIVTHSVTDDAIMKWKKYFNKTHPVSIIRRITKLNNGNPREIIPIAYFKCKSDDVSGIKKSRKLESKWLRHARENYPKTASEEWFRINLGELSIIINEIQKNDNALYSELYVIRYDK